MTDLIYMQLVDFLSDDVLGMIESNNQLVKDNIGKGGGNYNFVRGEDWQH